MVKTQIFFRFFFLLNLSQGYRISFKLLKSFENVGVENVYIVECIV